MGIIGRIRRVTIGRLEDFLARAEDPELVFPQLIREMEEQIRVATDTEAKAMATVKGAERELEQANAKLAKMNSGAESALAKGDEGMAREALEAQINIEAEVARRSETLAVANEAFANARAARVETQAQLQEIRAKKDEIITRARVAKSQDKIHRTVSGPAASTGSILDAVASLESQVEEREASLAARRDVAGGSAGGGPSLERRIDAMNTATEIDRRMAELKQKVAAKG